MASVSGLRPPRNKAASVDLPCAAPVAGQGPRCPPCRRPKPRTSSSRYSAWRRSLWWGCSLSSLWGGWSDMAMTCGEEAEPPRYSQPGRSGGLPRSRGAASLPTASLSSKGTFPGGGSGVWAGFGSRLVHELYKSRGEGRVVSLGASCAVAPSCTLLRRPSQDAPSRRCL